MARKKEESAEPRSLVLEAELGRYEMTMGTVTARIKRGEASWAYFYTLLGFALTIETGIASMFELPWSLIGFVLVAAATVYLIMFNGRFQNQLINWKSRYENVER